MDNFATHYAIAALWSSIEEDEPLDANYSISDLAPSTQAKMQSDCDAFRAANNIPEYNDSTYSDEEKAGHDFWLTRNGHGAGFWDRGLGDIGEELTEAAHAFGEQDLYVGDDGKIYIAGSENFPVVPE